VPGHRPPSLPRQSDRVDATGDHGSAQFEAVLGERVGDAIAGAAGDERAAIVGQQRLFDGVDAQVGGVEPACQATSKLVFPGRPQEAINMRQAHKPIVTSGTAANGCPTLPPLPTPMRPLCIAASYVTPSATTWAPGLASWAKVHWRGGLSGRQRKNLVPCRNRSPVIWS